MDKSKDAKQVSIRTIRGAPVDTTITQADIDALNEGYAGKPKVVRTYYKGDDWSELALHHTGVTF
jgi:hypothetical protein